MSTIRAAQLVYSRVEPPYSPERKSGFQTVYRSRTLSDTVVRAIEEYVQCYRPNSSLTRLQFFQLKNGDVVLSSTIRVAPHLEIVDKEGRHGAFIAHCLVLTQSEFAKVDYYPFAIFERYSFLDDPENMIHTLGRATGVAPLVEIETERPYYSPYSNWSGVEALKLVSLALQADALTKNGRSVLLVGGSEHINEALKTAFFLTPKSKRLACSFDTYIERCPTKRGLYWAVGATTSQRGSSYIPVNATQRRVTGRIADLKANDLYLVWLNYAISQGNLDQAMKKAFTIQSLVSAFDHRQKLQVDELDEDACQEFTSLNEKLVWRRVAMLIAGLVGKDLAESLTGYLRQTVDEIDVRYLLSAASVQSLKASYLSGIAARWILKHCPSLSPRDLKSLQNLAWQGNDMRLLYLSSVLRKKVDTKTRDKALEHMNPKTFRDTLELLMEPIAPANLVTPNYLSILLSDGRLQNMTSEQFVDLVQGILKIGAEDQLDALTGHVMLLDNDSLHQIEKSIKKRPNTSSGFKQAVITRREELGRRVRRLGLF